MRPIRELRALIVRLASAPRESVCKTLMADEEGGIATRQGIDPRGSLVGVLGWDDESWAEYG